MLAGSVLHCAGSGCNVRTHTQLAWSIPCQCDGAGTQGPSSVPHCAGPDAAARNYTLLCQAGAVPCHTAWCGNEPAGLVVHFLAVHSSQLHDQDHRMQQEPPQPPAVLSWLLLLPALALAPCALTCLLTATFSHTCCHCPSLDTSLPSLPAATAPPQPTHRSTACHAVPGCLAGSAGCRRSQSGSVRPL